MKYEDVKVNMLVTDGKVTGIVTHIYEIGHHKPITVKAKISEAKSSTMNFWPGELKEILSS